MSDLIRRLQSQEAVDGNPHEIEQLTDEAASALETANSRLAELETERDAFRTQATLNQHMVITCGVAASHPDPNLSRTGAYASAWNSEQANKVRALRDDRDRLRARVAELDAHIAAASVGDSRAAFETALVELVNKIDIGLDSGDLLKDAARASSAIDAILVSGDLVANAYDHFRDDPARYTNSVDFRIGWDACLDAIGNARAAVPARAGAAHAAHADDLAADRFATAMKAKMATSRSRGRYGWDNKDLVSGEALSDMLRQHVAKGDPVDVANFCMMLHQRGELIFGTTEPQKDSGDMPAVSGGESAHVTSDVELARIQDYAEQNMLTLEEAVDELREGGPRADRVSPIGATKAAAADVRLPQLKDGEEFICDSGCGTIQPEQYDFEYSREVLPDGSVISKTEKAWRAPCCKAGVLVYSNREETSTRLDDYAAPATSIRDERLSAGVRS
ncbi:hypothetical protein [Paraburkholderia sp.]|uniref:hypothetical protein n=1 Tax=Paraburkholderia sp. TaxID=1926495 RepID=UPI003C7E6571